MTDEAKLTPRQRAEAMTRQRNEEAQQHRDSTLLRIHRDTPTYELGYELVDEFPDLLEDTGVDVSYLGHLDLTASIDAVEDATPLLAAATKHGFHLKGGMEIDEIFERLEWDLENSDGMSVRIKAAFDVGAKCQIVKTQVGTRHVEARDVPTYETKVVCEDEEEEFHA